MLSVELTCPGCHWRTLCGDEEIARRLRQLGLFRRAPDPPEELILELLKSHGARLACDHCRQQGLVVDQDAAGRDDDDWQTAVVCEVCRKAIPDERLQALPDAQRCVACQDAEDRGATAVEPDYCPKCGSLLELRVARGSGVTRYKLACTGQPPCRL